MPLLRAAAGAAGLTTSPGHAAQRRLGHPRLPPGACGSRGRLPFIWRVRQPPLDGSTRSTRPLVDHVNRNVRRAPCPSATASVMGCAAASTSREIGSASSRALIVYLQSDHAVRRHQGPRVRGAVAARRRGRRRRVGARRRPGHRLAAGLSGVSDEMLKRYESLVVRDQRYDGQLKELRTAITAMQQSTLAFRRELERVVATGLPTAATAAHQPPTAAPAVSATPSGTQGEHQQLGAERPPVSYGPRASKTCIAAPSSTSKAAWPTTCRSSTARGRARRRLRPRRVAGAAARAGVSARGSI